VYLAVGGISVTFSIGTEFSNMVADPTPDDQLTDDDFWAIDAAHNDAWRYDDRAFGDKNNGKSKVSLKEKWVLYGIAVEGEKRMTGYTYTWGGTEAGNYIFIADFICDQYAGNNADRTTPAEVETVNLMHEMGHSIGIIALDKEGKDPDGDGTAEDYDDRPKSVMNMIGRFEFDKIINDFYSTHYWNLRDVDNYEL